MSLTALGIPSSQLLEFGFPHTNNMHYQLAPEELIEDCVCSGEGLLSNTGALVINTGEFTGRSPKDKFIVKDSTTQDAVFWNNARDGLLPGVGLGDCGCHRGLGVPTSAWGATHSRPRADVLSAGEARPDSP